MVIYVTLFATAALAALAITPLVRRWARLAGVLDLPTARGVHLDAVPRGGGVAMAAAGLVGLLGVSLWEIGRGRAVPVDLPVLWPILLGGAIVLALGLIDDLRPVSPPAKLAVQLLAAGVVVTAGLEIERVTVFGATFALGRLAIPLTLVWIIGITNAFNLLDGLDGLVTGLAIIAASTCATVLIFRGHGTEAALLVALVGAAVGFLPYNFHPASIFLGDSGSLVIGFILAVTAVTGWQKGTTVLASGVPLLIFALPIADTGIAVLRRWFRRSSGNQPSLARRFARLFDPDRRHVHHRLLGIGLSQRRTVLVLYVVSLGLSAIALLTMQAP